MTRGSRTWPLGVWTFALVLAACSGDVKSARVNSSTTGMPGAVGTMGGGAGTTPGSADDTGPPQPRPMSLEGDPIYSRFVRLTNEQWLHSVQDILGLDQAPDAVQGFERPVAGTTDFANNEHVLSVTNALWQSYQLASEQAADLITGSSARLSALYSATDPAGF